MNIKLSRSFICLAKRREYNSLLSRALRYSTDVKRDISTSNMSRDRIKAAIAMTIAAGTTATIMVQSNQEDKLPYDYIMTKIMDPVLMPILRMFDPETAHRLAIFSAAHGLMPKLNAKPDSEILHVKTLGKTFTNPIGIAAGFDKNAEAIDGLLDLGFGYVEIGSVTPRPQSGNAKPRVFRLSEDRAVINRYGFNSDGCMKVAERLDEFQASRPKNNEDGKILGVNLGKNKETEDAVADYVEGVQTLGKFADYLVVNVSSPNTPGLRSLQGRKQLYDLISRVLVARNKLEEEENRKIPLLVKIAPDLTENDKQDIAAVSMDLMVDGLIISNTSISRPSTLQSASKSETGGLSGAPIRDMSTKVLSDMYRLTEGKIPLIGVGGVANGQDAYEKIKAGASLVQMYSCLVYDGPLAVQRAKHELTELLQADGYDNVMQAVGTAHSAIPQFKHERR